MLSVTYLINRIASLKLEPERHPIEGDSRARLLRLGIVASARRFDLPLRTRALYMAWFIAAVLSPKTLTMWLVSTAFYPERRGVLSKLV
ncbi:MAG: hypothetical protein H0V47_04040 [Chloroflexia bacterium]|nr:hypothetical protein [Chloroflexia bacterium]